LVKLSFEGSAEAQGEVPVTLRTCAAATIHFQDVPVIKRNGAFVVETAVTGGENAVALPPSFQLLANYPNPFNAGTHIPYQLPEDAEVEMRIYSVDGQLVRALNPGQQPAGHYLAPGQAAHWDGLDSAHRKAASGVYLCTLRAGHFVSTRKIVMLK
jgi:flagellar hook capping protein FlgD